MGKYAASHIVIYFVIITAFHCIYGLEILDPTNINWLMSVRHDWGQHYLGWAFYRNEPWTFPLGFIGKFIYPVGSNIGFTDSIPLIAIPLKLFSGILPDNFQYFGVWLLSCYLLSAHYTHKIFRLYNVHPVIAAAATLLIVFNPVLVFRAMHPSLCAHWLLIASLYYYLQDAHTGNVKALNRKQVLLTVISCLVNPYLTLMIIGFNVILPFKHFYYNKLLTIKQAIVYPVMTGIAVLALWMIVGLVSPGNGNNLGVTLSYGLYGMNLNSLHNSGGFSRVFPGLETVNSYQYEGYMYLGIAFFVLLVFALAAVGLKGMLKQQFFRKTQLLPLLLLAVALGIFAITHVITFNKIVLAQVPIPEILEELGSIFRASGRFFWLPYYLILFFAAIGTAKVKLHVTARASILVLALILQFWELQPLYTSKKLLHGDYDSPLNEEHWKEVIAPFDKMITYPPFNNHLLNSMDYQDLCYIALKNGKSISTGYSARENTEAYNLYTLAYTEDLAKGNTERKSIYITTEQYLDIFSQLLLSEEITTRYIDGYYLFYEKDAGNNINLPVDAEGVAKVKAIKEKLQRDLRLEPMSPPMISDGNIKFNIESKTVGKNLISIKGWAYLENQARSTDSLFVVIKSAGAFFRTTTAQVNRPDLVSAFKNQALENAGFASTFNYTGIKADSLALGIAIKTEDGRWYFKEMGEVNKTELGRPVTVKVLPPFKDQLGNLENFAEQGNVVAVSGWTSFTTGLSPNAVIKVVLKGGDNFTIGTEPVVRKDVTDHFKGKHDMDGSGFRASFDKNSLPPGNYELGVMVTDGKKSSTLMFNKNFKVN